MQGKNAEQFPEIPKDFPDPSLYYNEDDLFNPVFYEWLYLLKVNAWFKTIIKEYNQITGHENSFPVSPTSTRDVGNAEYLRGYKTAIEDILKLWYLYLKSEKTWPKKIIEQ